MKDGAVAIADIDNDNDLDILIAGQTVAGRKTILYRKDLSGYVTVEDTPFVHVNECDLAFSDIDLDGDIDLLIVGISNENFGTYLYLNDGAGNFSEVVEHPFVSIDHGSLAFADIDGDTDEDLVMVGSFSSPFMPVSDLYINNQVVSKIEVASETIVPFQLYPNPTRDGRVNIDHVFNTAGECEVFLYDIDGRLISRQTELVVVGLNYLNLHYQGLSSGGYFVQLSDGGVTVTKMFFVQ